MWGAVLPGRSRWPLRLINTSEPPCRPRDVDVSPALSSLDSLLVKAFFFLVSLDVGGAAPQTLKLLSVLTRFRPAAREHKASRSETPRLCFSFCPEESETKARRCLWKQQHSAAFQCFEERRRDVESRKRRRGDETSPS